MTSTFLGKWRIRLIFIDMFAVYRPGGVGTGLSAWMMYREAIKETNTAFILRSDSKLCFQLNNGKFVGSAQPAFVFRDTLAEARPFIFPDVDHSKLPAEFDSKIKVDDNFFDKEWFVFWGAPYLLEAAPMAATDFKIFQVTPPLAGVQANGKADGLDFAWVDLTGGALDKVSLIGADFSHCNLTNFKFTNCTLTKAQLNNCIVAATDFSGSNLSGANLNELDLTGVVVGATPPHFFTEPLTPPTLAEPRPTFFKTRLNQSLLGNEWSRLNLAAATIENLSVPLSSEANPLKARFSVLAGLNQNNFSDFQLPHAIFDNAVLDGVNLNGADLTNASFIQASMHNTVLSNATLKNADLTGAQLGSLGQLFSLPAGFESHLNAGPNVDTALKDEFARHGISLSATATLHTQAAGRVWTLNDLGNKIVYTVRLETSAAESQALTVYKPAMPASLVNAYMPDAILTGANLFGITASNIQFYGSRARVDGSAILEEAKLNNSNLSTVNFTQAQLRGANLSNCYLFDAKFNKANLSQSANGSVVDLSGANLQGADFTDAQLFGANLTNAAVAIKLPTKFNPTQGGVYLFSLPYKGDTTTLAQYTSELTAAATSFFSLNPDGDPIILDAYVKALKAKDVGPLKTVFLRHRITLSANAEIQVIEADNVWQITDDTKSFTLWTGPDPQGNTELYAASSLPQTRAAFKRSSQTLRLQASATVDAPDQQWLLDNDSDNPKNFSTGYVRFILKLNGNVLDVYGTALRILRLSDRNQDQFATATCQVTTISESNMNADTICPNGASLIVNQSRSGKSWDTLWLRAALPPRPPDCVPTKFSWCPPPKTRM